METRARELVEEIGRKATVWSGAQIRTESTQDLNSKTYGASSRNGRCVE